MEEKLKNSEALFVHLVWVFQAAALQHLGVQPNPITKKTETDLEQAKMSISILEMIREKTSGNLNEQEKKFLDHVLTELRLEYVRQSDLKTAKEDKKSSEGADEKTESAS